MIGDPTNTMLLPKGGVTWKSAKARIPPWRALVAFLIRTRTVLALALVALVVLLWRGVALSTSHISKFVVPSDEAGDNRADRVIGAYVGVRASRRWT